MSRSKKYWYFHVRKVIMIYPGGLGDSIQDVLAKNAIKKAISETVALPDGETRMRFIDLVYFRKTHSQHGAAMEVYVSFRTARRWGEAFVKKVAEEMGYR